MQLTIMFTFIDYRFPVTIGYLLFLVPIGYLSKKY